MCCSGVKLRHLISKLTENAVAEQFWPQHNDRRHSGRGGLGKEDPSSLFRKLLLWWEVHDKWEISLNYFAGNYWQNVNGLWDCFLQLVLQPDCLVEKWQEDACSKCCSQNELPCFSSIKKQFAEQIVPLSDMPVCYFKDPTMKRDKPESLQTKQVRKDKKSSLLISLISNTRQKKIIHRWPQQFSSKS